jgi:O-antigen/teichoic acid export membrane protein
LSAPASPPQSGGAQAASEARRYGRTAGLLSVGVGATGFVTYLYFALASHNLSKEEYGEIAVLWSALFIIISTLHRPVEQLLSRTIAERESHGQPIRQPMRVAATIQLGVGVGFVALALALRGPVEDGLLSGNKTLYWILLVAVTAYAASYFARGFLAGSRRFALYAVLILSESVSRTAFPLAAAVGITSGQTAVAIGIAVAPCLSLVAVPLAFRRRAVQADERPGPAPVDQVEFTLSHGGGFAAAVLVIMLSEQTFLNAGPLLIKASSGAAAAGFIFNVLMVARAPLQLFQAISTSLLPHLTSLRSRPGQDAEQAFRLSVRVTLLAVTAFTGVVAATILVAGPDLMQLAFGDKFTYQRVDLLIIAAGMGLYLSSVTLNQAALAQGQVRRAAACWIACAAGFIVWCLLPVMEELRRVEVGFAAAAAILCALLYLIYRRPHARPEDVVRPGSPEELEARLAAADEGS